MIPEASCHACALISFRRGGVNKVNSLTALTSCNFNNNQPRFLLSSARNNLPVLKTPEHHFTVLCSCVSLTYECIDGNITCEIEMAGTTQDSHSSAAGDALRAPKRRKLRKGTQSCWECKRRKTRCTFAADTDSVCDGCRSRQVKCISQEVHDDVGKVHAKADRLSRMESLIEQLVHRGDTAVPISPHSPSTTKNRCVLSVVRKLIYRFRGHAEFSRNQ